MSVSYSIFVILAVCRLSKLISILVTRRQLGTSMNDIFGCRHISFIDADAITSLFVDNDISMDQLRNNIIKLNTIQKAIKSNLDSR